MKNPTGPSDFAAIRARLSSLQGEQYWRCLNELADHEGFQACLRRDFPHVMELDAVNRREFLKLMAASLALAGLGACSPPPAERIVPYVRAPEEIIPGRPLFYATAMTINGAATGLLVESHMGRPTKVEGNPEHPTSLGATDIYGQASVLTLYDPDRSQTVTYRRNIRPWSSFVATIREAADQKRKTKGQGLRILTETVNSPTLAAQIRALLRIYPAARWHQYEPASRNNSRAGSLLAFGEYVETQHRFDRAQVVLAFDADPIGCNGGNLRHAREFAAGRRPRADGPPMVRLYAVESSPSITGAIADHRLVAAPDRIEVFARAVANRLGVSGAGEPDQALMPDHRSWLDALIGDLKRHSSSSIVIAGERQPPRLHALVHAINQTLGNTGRTIFYTEPVEAEPVDQIESLGELVSDMEAGTVDLLVMVGGNPVYTAPADFRFVERLQKVGTSVHLSLYQDETSYLSHWHIPEAHFLESWSDARAHDGTISIVQPLIAPLYGGRTAHELLATLGDEPGLSSYDIVRAYWQGHLPAARFDLLWEQALHDGFIRGTAYKPKPVSVKAQAAAATSENGAASSEKKGGFDLIFAPDPTVGDGRFANNGWLQELPKPLTNLTWENVALISPATAARLDLDYDIKASGGAFSVDLVDIEHGGRTLRAPAWIMPGHADDAVTLHLGYGRRRAGRVGSAIGFNAYALRTADNLWVARGAEVRKSGRRHLLAATQIHHSMEGRNLVRAATVDEYRRNPQFAQSPDAPKESLYPDFSYPGYAWGMTVDLNACVGCNACIVACQAENNIPIVGKDQVLRSREMHWLRVDIYHKGGADNPETYFQPVPCMHCEKAPCEVVCPVTATVHSAEGLNDMVYNRCVGTRYCSNNCPYKVRRFNFFEYADWETPSLRLLRNPDVTVRSRGVMEKCTYCVQRINQARIESEKEGRKIRDGEVVTACQAACPTEAIVFGDINDPQSKVSKLKAEPRNYGLLSELNTRPRTTYLARLRNPNPEIEKAAKE